MEVEDVEKLFTIIGVEIGYVSSILAHWKPKNMFAPREDTIFKIWKKFSVKEKKNQILPRSQIGNL